MAGKPGRPGVDGEMIAVDGRFYQVTSDGAVQVVYPSVLVPVCNRYIF